MTYLAKPRPPFQRYRRKPGLSGFIDDVIGNIPGITPPTTAEKQCLDQANTQLAPLDAKIDDLVKTWKPTGFYTSDDVRTLVSGTMATVRQAQASLDQITLSGAQESILRATDDLARAGQRALDYLQAANDADAKGLRTINAVGLKRWVTDTLAAASSAMVTAATIACIEPWWLSAVAAFQQAFDAIWMVAKRVVGAVLAIGETALKLADDLPNLYDIIKIGALAAGGYWVWTRYLKQPNQ